MEYQIDPLAYDCLVLNLPLQPLVENLIKHGIARIPIGGKLRITANLRNQSLLLFVANSGPLLSSDPLKAPEDGLQLRRGIGLANTSARLRALYGDAHSFELRNWHESGVEACITIPVRPVHADLPEKPLDLEERFTHEGSYR